MRHARMADFEALAADCLAYHARRGGPWTEAWGIWAAMHALGDMERRIVRVRQELIARGELAAGPEDWEAA